MRNEPTETESRRRTFGISRRSVVGLFASVAASPLLVTRAHAARTAWSAGTRALQSLQPSGVRPRYLHASVGLPDGRLIVIGGYTTSEATRSRSASAPTSSVQLYDPSRDAWYELAPLRTPRARHAAVVMPDGRVVVMGGVYASPLTSVEVYDPASNEWFTAPSLPAPMFDHAAAVCDGRVVVTGGQNGTPAFSLSI